VQPQTQQLFVTAAVFGASCRPVTAAAAVVLVSWSPRPAQRLLESRTGQLENPQILDQGRGLKDARIWQPEVANFVQTRVGVVEEHRDGGTWDRTDTRAKF